MANICDFNMIVKGKKENIEKFYNALTQQGDIWMGRGAEAEIDYEQLDDSEDIYSGNICGWCKWSIQSALVDNARSMRTEPERWSGLAASEYITLWEACERWDLKMEVYSEETGMCFQEHYIYVDGEMIDECVDYEEYWIEDYDTKEEAEEELGIEITDEEWKEQGFIFRGGFNVWIFHI